MRNKKRLTQEESTLLQEIISTYRYPDGTLNGIAVFISTLALVLLLIFGHFTIKGIKNIAGLNKVSASELTLAEIEDYITDSYLDAISEYTHGNMDKEAARRKILKHLSETINSSEAFTTTQKEQLMEEIANYISNIDIDVLLTDSTAIKEINAKLDKYIQENAASLELLKATLEQEIKNTNVYTDEQIAVLKDLLDKLTALELSHYNRVNQMIDDANRRIDALDKKTTDSIKKLDKKTTDNINELDKKSTDSINELDKKSTDSINNLDKKSIDSINSLDEKSTKNLQLTKEALIELINNNKSLTDEQCALLLKLINDNANSNSAELEKLKERIQFLEKKSKASDAPTKQENADGTDFDFAYKNGVYGYWVEDVFYPF